MVRFIESTQHAAANQLFEMIKTANPDFTLSQTMITWQTKNSTLIINLMFMSRYLWKTLIHRKTKLKLNQSLDYIFILLSILLSSVWTEDRHFRIWKQIEIEKLRKLCNDISQSDRLQNTIEINAFIRSLKKCLRWTVKKKVFWKWSHNQFTFYWNDGCSEKIKKMRKLRQTFIN